MIGFVCAVVLRGCKPRADINLKAGGTPLRLCSNVI